VALGGAVPTSQALKEVHQMTDSVAICRPVTKFSASTNCVESIGEVMANAFRAAESGRPGAAFVNLPSDIMAAPCPYPVLTSPAFSGQGPADAAAVLEAARLISAAATPVVLLGMQTSGPASAAAIHSFIGRNNLPVVGTFQAAGAVGAHLFDNFGGRVGQLANQPADRLLAAADLVITIGYDPIEYPPSDWNRGRAHRIIHIDVLTADIDNCYEPTVELTGDIVQTLEDLTPLVRREAQSALSSSLLKQIVAERRALTRAAAAHNGIPVHPMRLIHELQAFLGDDVTLCLDIGSFYLWIARYLYSFRARQILISNGQQTLGVALPWAIAASIVRPSDKVLSISGDGGFLYSAMELETAVRLKANITHMVWVDGGYNMVAVQQLMKYGRTCAVDFGPVDLVKYAEAFGATGLMVNSPDEITPVLKRSFDTPGPVVVGVPVDYRDNHKLFETVDAGRLQ
jgi:acetolactate synthase-1/2/3 large subunit